MSEISRIERGIREVRLTTMLALVAALDGLAGAEARARAEVREALGLLTDC